jgi:hypothetical protein
MHRQRRAQQPPARRFEDLPAARVIEAEQNSEVCLCRVFSIMDGDDSHRVYQVIKTYE